MGHSEYVARKGVTASAKGVFWLRVLQERPDGVLVVENVTEGAKTHIDKVTVDLEPDLLYPLLLGRDVGRWKAAPSSQILLTHKKGMGLKAIAEEAMQEDYPRTYAYLKGFEATLKQTGIVRRYFTKQVGSRRVSTGPFYSMFNVGTYTLSYWKVVWPEISSTLKAAVIGSQGGKPVIPDHKLVMLATETEDEAHFIAAVLNSAPCNLVSASYGISTQLSTNFFSYVRVPLYDSGEELHRRLAGLSKQLHAYHDPLMAQEAEAEVDRLTGKLWSLSSSEVAELISTIARRQPSSTSSAITE